MTLDGLRIFSNIELLISTILQVPLTSPQGFHIFKHQSPFWNFLSLCFLHWSVRMRSSQALGRLWGGWSCTWSNFCKLSRPHAVWSLPVGGPCHPKLTYASAKYPEEFPLHGVCCTNRKTARWRRVKKSLVHPAKNPSDVFWLFFNLEMLTQ